MHNIWVRLNAVIFFALTVLLCMALACWFSTLTHAELPKIKTLKVNTFKSLRNHGGLDRALFSFDVHADFRPAFHWNLKQLFVYMVAEYPTELNPVNQVIIWDKIVTSPEDAVLKLKNEPLKYALIDQGMELRNKTITLKLLWDHMPITGAMYFGDDSAGTITYKLPKRYKTS